MHPDQAIELARQRTAADRDEARRAGLRPRHRGLRTARARWCVRDWAMPTLHVVTPILNVSDVPASIAYYVDVLGFERPWHWGDPATFGGVRTAGGHEIMFCQNGQGSPGTWLSVWVDDVDALHDRFRRATVDVRQEPTTFPWGVREMNVADPDGHRIRFSMPTREPADGRPLTD